jgi:hypothetical protein
MPFHPSKQFFGLLGAILAIAAHIPYIISIARGKTKPHVFSWTIWALVGIIAAAAQYADGAGPGMWVSATSGVTSVGIAIFALFRRADVEINRTDWVAFALALAAIPLWRITHQPLAAALMATFANLMAFAVTMRKIWARPQTENVLSYHLHASKFAAGLMGMEAYTAATVIYPVIFLLANFLTGMLIVWRKKRLRNK